MEQTYNITIRRADLGFVLEALKLRAVALAEEIVMQTLAIERKEISERAQQAKSEWTIKAEGDSFVAVNKDTNQKRKPEAPYGYKADGTPKKRPGRPKLK